MALQDVADKIDKAEAIASDLPESELRHRLILVLGDAYKALVGASSEIVAQLDELQDATRDARHEADM